MLWPTARLKCDAAPAIWYLDTAMQRPGFLPTSGLFELVVTAAGIADRRGPDWFRHHFSSLPLSLSFFFFFC